QMRLLLAKNPAGWLEAFDVLDEPPVPVLLSVNAREPDGRDTSWLWDVDYRVLRGRPVFVTGERRLDLAVRLEADLVPFELVEGVDEAVDRVSGGGVCVVRYRPAVPPRPGLPCPAAVRGPPPPPPPGPRA